MRRYPSRHTKSTQNSQLFRISPHLGINVVSQKALKIVNFSGHPLTRICMFLHQKHSKFSIFQDILSPGYPCPFIKSTRNRQLFRIPSHLGIHLVTPKAHKLLNFSGYPLTWVSMSFHQKHSKSRTFEDTISLGY